LTSEDAIHVRGLSKRFYYDRHQTQSLRKLFIRHVLRKSPPGPPQAFSIEDLTFSVGRGECVGIVGGNGSGKSSLLRVSAGIYRPSGGEARCIGTRGAVLELGAGFHKELTGADNIVTYAAGLGLSKPGLRSRWSDIVKFADIGDVLDKPMKHYSTGMQARLALSVCLCGDFDVLLLDEALSVGDQAFRHKVNKRLHEFHANGGTLLMVSHDLDQLKYLCSRTIWLRNGSIAMDGETRDVLTMYKKEG
jgi:ABC-type polysaccharide/polyol phosphate transport system ATPase subunit